MAATYILANKERLVGWEGMWGVWCWLAKRANTQEAANTQSPDSTTDLYRINCGTRPHRCASTAAHRETRCNRIPQQVLAATITARPQRENKRTSQQDRHAIGAARLRSNVSDQNKHACSSAARKDRLQRSCAVRFAFRWNKKRSCFAANPSPCHRQLCIMHGTRGIPNSPRLTSPRAAAADAPGGPNQAGGGGEENRLIYHSKTWNSRAPSSMRAFESHNTKTKSECVEKQRTWSARPARHNARNTTPKRALGIHDKKGFVNSFRDRWLVRAKELPDS